MADNDLTYLNPTGEGAVPTAWKDIGGIRFQRFIACAPDGTDLGTAANGIAVDVTRVTGTVTVVDQHIGTVFDFNTGAGSQNVSAFGLALPSGAGATLVSAANPLPVYVSGSQEVFGEVTIGNDITVAASALPTGAATEATLATLATAAGLTTVAGADVTGAAMPAGGSGLRGWLSAIWSTLTARLPAALTAGGNLKISIQESGATVNISDNGGAVSVDDNGGSITVDGTLAVSNLGGGAADFDTGAGVSTLTMYGLAMPGAGGAVAVGAANPMPISDNGGSITVDGIVSAVQSGGWAVSQSGAWGVSATQSGAWAVTVSASALPAGAATEATLTASAPTATGAAVPAKAYFMGGTDGANLRAVLTDAAGHLLTIPAGSVAAGVAATSNPTAEGALDDAGLAQYLRVTSKGTQGQRGLNTQPLRDTGRNLTIYFMALPVLTTNADVLMSLTGWKAGAAVGATTTPAVVTAGKTFRVTGISVTYIATATAGEVRVSLRANTGGAVVVGSPVVCSWVVGAVTPATAGSSLTVALALPDGVEFAAGTGIGITIAGVGVTGALAVAGYAQVSLTGFEY